jgi:hypothetical protein
VPRLQVSAERVQDAAQGAWIEEPAT